MEYLKHLWYWFSEARKQPSGLLPLVKDKRDIQLEHIFGWSLFGAYNPKEQSKRLTPVFIKNQRSHSNCSFQAWSNTLAVFFGEEISARYLTAKAYQQGLCGAGGFADIRSGAKIAQKFGCCTEAECPSDETLPWNQYVALDFVKFDALASNRKIGSYYSVGNTDNYLKAIDNNHPSTLGRTWLSGMNQGGGFSFPWILQRKGYTVGGHSCMGGGYDMNYHGIKTDIEPNSYGADWGDNGYFYCPLTDLQGDINQFGAFAITDVIYTPKMTTQDIIDQYGGKNVKGDRGSAIYLIYEGQKFEYKGAEAFASVNGYPYSASGAFVLVPQTSIDAVPFYGGSETTSLLDGSSGQYADIISRLKKPVNDQFQPNITVNQ